MRGQGNQPLFLMTLTHLVAQRGNGREMRDGGGREKEVDETSTSIFFFFLVRGTNLFFYDFMKFGKEGGVGGRRREEGEEKVWVKGRLFALFMIKLDPLLVIRGGFFFSFIWNKGNL